jgi:hypothetical protein
LDIGCGRGAWLKACHELGSTALFGFDGNWNHQAMMIDDAIEFKTVNLNQRFEAPPKVDLVMSLEVAEHLDPASAPQFVECLANASDTVLFSAAYTGQGGVDHLNEQPHSYWATLFLGVGYVPFDLFRPVFWHDERVPFWYRQNTFLYVKLASTSHHHLLSSGLIAIANTRFMDCIHPELYAVKLDLISQAWCERKKVPGFIRTLNKRIRTRKNSTNV